MYSVRSTLRANAVPVAVPLLPRHGRTPMAAGLYDPAYEHDACGVGMVADLHGRPTTASSTRRLTVLERLAHRGASGAEVNTGDGAGILVQVPHRFLVARRPRPGFSLPAAGGYAVGLVFLPTDADDAAKARDGGGAAGGRGGARACSAGASCPSTPRGWADRPGRHAAHRAALRGRRPARPVGHHGARTACLRAAQAGRARRRRALLPLAVGTHDRLQGHAHLAPAAPVLPRPARPPLRVRPGPGALALLDQHLPELAAGPPLPLHGPQRGDQHRPGQPQLDAGP